MNKNELTENDVDFIMANTDFTKAQILKWYDDFKQKCPERRLDKASFVKFYRQLIPGESGSEIEFCEAVFKAFDTDNNGYIDFGEFLIAFWVRAKGSLKDKLNWLFDVYDTDNSHYITQYELAKMLRLLFSIKNISEEPYARAKVILNEMDRSRDGRVTRQEFIAACTKDEKLRNLFAPY